MADPTVALNVRGPAVGTTTVDPIHSAVELGRFQIEMNQARLQQHQFMARQRAGEIMSAAPSLEAGLDAVAKDPLAGPFAGELVGQYRQAAYFQRQYNESVTKETTSALEAAHKASPSLFHDPDQWNSSVNSIFKSLSPEAQRRAGPAFQAMTSGLYDGLPADQAARQAEWSKRVYAFTLGSQVTPETIRGITGQITPAFHELEGPEGEKLPSIVGAPLGGRTVATPLTILQPPGSPTAQPAPAQPTAQPAPGAPVQPAAQPAPGQAPAPILTPPPPQEVPLRGQTTFEKKSSEGLAKSFTDTVDEVNSAAKGVGALTNSMDAIQDLMGFFRTGAWAQSRENVAMFIRGASNTLGIPKEQQDKFVAQIMGADSARALSAQQEFEMLINRYSVQQLTEVAKGTGRIMRPEVDAFMSGLGKFKEPEAIMDYINRQGRPLVQGIYDRVQHFPEFEALVKARKANPGSFESWYLQTHHTTPDRLPTITSNGVPIGPRPMSSALGAGEAPRPQVTVGPDGQLRPVQPQQTPGTPGAAAAH
jgi:hypothetical protein